MRRAIISRETEGLDSRLPARSNLGSNLGSNAGANATKAVLAPQTKTPPQPQLRDSSAYDVTMYPNRQNCSITAALVALLAYPSDAFFKRLMRRDGQVVYAEHKAPTRQAATILGTIQSILFSRTVPLLYPLSDADAGGRSLSQLVVDLRDAVPDDIDSPWNALNRMRGGDEDPNELLRQLAPFFFLDPVVIKREVGVPIAQVGPMQAGYYPNWGIDTNEQVVQLSQIYEEQGTLVIPIDHDVSLYTAVSWMRSVVHERREPFPLTEEHHYQQLMPIMSHEPRSRLGYAEIYADPDDGTTKIRGDLLERQTIDRLGRVVICAIEREFGSGAGGAPRPRLRLTGERIMLLDRLYTIRALILRVEAPCFLSSPRMTVDEYRREQSPNHFVAVVSRYDGKFVLCDDLSPEPLDVTRIVMRAMYGVGGGGADLGGGSAVSGDDDALDQEAVRLLEKSICTVLLEEE